MWRLRAFLKGLAKLVLVCAGLVALFVGWRAFLRWGPPVVNRGSVPPAMFTFHAKALLRPLETIDSPEVLLPLPQHLSSQDMQLKLMKLRDDRNWLPQALALGEPRKHGLLLHSGTMTVEEVLSVGSAQLQGASQRCQVRIRVRWVFPEALQELYRVRELVDLRMPKDFLPGQSTIVTCTFVQRDWTWELATIEPALSAKVAMPARQGGIAEWLY
jgi:hypothetical protein